MPGIVFRCYANCPANALNVVITSPPYTLEFKKEYGNVAKSKYVDWLKPFGQEICANPKTRGQFQF